MTKKNFFNRKLKLGFLGLAAAALSLGLVFGLAACDNGSGDNEKPVATLTLKGINLNGTHDNGVVFATILGSKQRIAIGSIANSVLNIAIPIKEEDLKPVTTSLLADILREEEGDVGRLASLPADQSSEETLPNITSADSDAIKAVSFNITDAEGTAIIHIVSVCL